MTLLSGIRNLISRRRSPLILDLPGPEQEAPDAEESPGAAADPREELELMEAVELEDEFVPRADAAAEAIGAEVLQAAESIGDQLDAHGKRLDAHGDRLVRHGGKLDAQGTQLDAHRSAVEAHGGQLEAHGGKLDAHGGQLEAHGGRLETLADRLGTHGSELETHGGRLETHREQLQRQMALVQALAEQLQTRLPQVLQETAEFKSRCAQVIDLVGEQAGEAQRRDDAVTETVNAAVTNAVGAGLKRLGDASSRDAAMLERIQKELASNTQALREAGESEQGAAHHLREVLELTVKLQRAVATLEQSTEGHSALVAARLAQTKRSMMMLAYACTLAALTALVIAVLALVT
jgi:chromosome segregation ATPase